MGKKNSNKNRRRNQHARRPSRPVPRNEQQYALIGDTLLDVEQAHRLLRASPRPRVRIDVPAWARLYGLDGDPTSPVKVGPTFDPAHALTADLNRPLILATFTTGEGAGAELIIDGSHRLYRAHLEGRDSLPAYLLTASETVAITLARPCRTGWIP